MQESEKVGTDETVALVRQMREALDAVAPHTDKLICYASTAAEHPENLIDGQVQAAIASADQWLAQQRGPLTDEQILDCVRAVGVPAPMGLTRDRGPYEITEPSWFLTQLVRAIERTHSIS